MWISADVFCSVLRYPSEGDEVWEYEKTAKLIKTNRSQNSCRISQSKRRLETRPRKCYTKDPPKTKSKTSCWEVVFMFLCFFFCFYHYFIPPFRIWGNVPPFRLLGFAAIFRHSPSFRVSSNFPMFLLFRGLGSPPTTRPRVRSIGQRLIVQRLINQLDPKPARATGQ